MKVGLTLSPEDVMARARRNGKTVQRAIAVALLRENIERLNDAATDAVIVQLDELLTSALREKGTTND